MPYTFPPNLGTQPRRPTIQFKVKGGDSVTLPIPAGVSINDSAEYSTIDLGTMGNFLRNVDTREGIEGVVNQLQERANENKSIKAGQLARIFGEKVGSDSEIGRRALFATKTIINPNTSTTFTGNSIRTFSFEFKMISASEDDTRSIHQIHAFFRKYAYPDSADDKNNIILEFPPVWKIIFNDTQNRENEHIPRVYECFLTGLTTTFNSSANMYRTDGSPVEVDIGLGFQETRSLIRRDIDQLANYQVDKDQLAGMRGL